MWLALVVSAALGASPNPYLAPAARLYQNLEFQEALRTIDDGLKWQSNTPEEEERAALLEGVITGQLGKTDRAMGAFKRALALDPDAKLPFRVSPKISRLFDRARKELGVTAKKTPPPAPPPPAPPPEKPVVVEKVPPPPPAAPAPQTRVIVAQADPPKPPTEAVQTEAAPPSESHLPLFGGALAVVDVLGQSFGSELFFGSRFGPIELTARCRPGPETGVGLLAAYDHDLGPLEVFAGIRGDVYVTAVVPGGGAVVGARKALIGPFGVVLAGSFEGFLTQQPQWRKMAAVASLGIEWRP